MICSKTVHVNGTCTKNTGFCAGKVISMKAVRVLFIMSVILAGIALAVIFARSPWGLTMSIFFFLAINGMKKGIKKFSAYGTARWADRSDLEQAGMLSATSGLIIGRMALIRPRFIEGMRALFDLRLKAAVACEQFMLSMRKLEPPAALVRLVKAVHILVTAPTGAGKGTSLVVPFLRNVDRTRLSRSISRASTISLPPMPGGQWVTRSSCSTRSRL